MIPLSTSSFVCDRRLLTPALNHLLMASSGWNWSIAGPSSSILIESFRVVTHSRTVHGYRNSVETATVNTAGEATPQSESSSSI